MDQRILSGSNWAIISQKHAVSLSHIDTAGVFTAIVVLSGIKYWAIRKTALDGGECDVDDADYWIDLSKRDYKTLPGGPDAWITTLLFPGDMLYAYFFCSCSFY